MKLDFNAAKEHVAKENGYKDFSDLVIKGTGVPSQYFEEAAELYAQWMCNQAVKEDRDWTKENFEHLIYYVEEIQDGEFRDVAKFIGVTRHLPFPQQSEYP